MFFDHRGLLEGREARAVHDTGASSFLYPFLGERETTSRRWWRTCAARCSRRRRRSASCARRRSRTTATSCWPPPRRCGADLDAGGRLLALGNGGSATDAMDVVADFRRPPDPRWRARRALDLTEDPAILTAIANDIGTEAIFAAPGDRPRARGRRPAGDLHERQLGERDRRAGGGALARAAHDRDGRLRRRAGGGRAARRPRGGHALRAHPAHPGGAGERLPRAAGAGGAGGRDEPRPRPRRGHGPGRGLPPLRLPARGRARAWPATC